MQAVEEAKTGRQELSEFQDRKSPVSLQQASGSVYGRCSLGDRVCVCVYVCAYVSVCEAARETEKVRGTILLCLRLFCKTGFHYVTLVVLKLTL